MIETTLYSIKTNMIHMLTPEQIKNKLQDRKLGYIAEQTGLSPQTLWYIKTGKSKNLAFSTIEKLSEYFEERP